MKVISNHKFAISQYLCFLSLFVPLHAIELQLIKCCNSNEGLDIISKKCTKLKTSDITENPINPSLSFFESESPQTENAENIFTSHELPACANGAKRQLAINEESTKNHIDADIFDFYVDVEHNGILFIDDGIHFTQHDQYCIDRGFKDKQFLGSLAMFCHIPIEIECQTKTCINSCCGQGMLYDIGTNYCYDPHEDLLSSRFLLSSPKSPSFKRRHSKNNRLTNSFQNFTARLLYDPDDLPIHDKASKQELDPRNKNLLVLSHAPECLQNNGYHDHNYTDQTLTIYNTGEIEVNEQLFDNSQYCLVHLDDINGHHAYQAKVCTPQVPGDTSEKNSTNKMKIFSMWMLLLLTYPYSC